MNILIHGVGKTGTTALFYTIRKALPGSVTELFEPVSLEFDGPPSAPQQHVLAKVLLRETIPVPYERFPWKIMTVRDPRDTLISRLLYLVWHAAFRSDPGCMNTYLTLLRTKERDPASIPLNERTEVHPDVARVARRKGYGDWRHWMTREDVAFFRPMLAPSLQELGYEDNWGTGDNPHDRFPVLL